LQGRAKHTASTWMPSFAIPQNSLWGTRRRECLPTANQVLELSLRLFRRACV